MESSSPVCIYDVGYLLLGTYGPRTYYLQIQVTFSCSLLLVCTSTSSSFCSVRVPIFGRCSFCSGSGSCSVQCSARTVAAAAKSCDESRSCKAAPLQWPTRGRVVRSYRVSRVPTRPFHQTRWSGAKHSSCQGETR